MGKLQFDGSAWKETPHFVQVFLDFDKIYKLKQKSVIVG